MNIAFDSTAILGPMSRNKRIGNYALSQFKALMKIDKENKYFFLNLFDKDFRFENEYENLQEIFLWCGTNRFLSMNPDYKEIYSGIIRNFIKKNNIDVFYITSPFDGHNFPYQREWFGNVKIMAMVYDIIPFMMKDIYLKDKNTYNWYMRCFEAFKYFDEYLVISESIKTDLIKYADIDKNKITVIHEVADPFFKKIIIGKNEKSLLLNKFSIINKFIMSTSGDDYRKNIQELIMAYNNLSPDLIDEYQLVIVCKLSLTSIANYKQIIKSYNLMGRVILTGYVTNDELLRLYNLADLMAFPSRYEGFGLPVAEAFACGTPVFTFNNSSLVEIAGNAAVLVDPFNIRDIARGLEYALKYADRKDLVQKGYQLLERYQWDTAASDTLNIINKYVPDVIPVEKKIEKLAFFTPLPPLQSGISDYSFDIIHVLSSYINIDVYIDDEYIPSVQLPSTVQIYNHKKYKKNHRKYLDTVYQVGNSLFHTYMYEYIRKYKGIVVLHDYNLHTVAYAYTVHIIKDVKEYTRFLLEDYSQEQINDIHAVILDTNTSVAERNKKINEIPMNGFITNYATKIIVHSNQSRENLLRKNISNYVRTIPSYAIISPLKNNHDIKTKYGYKADDLIFASFGHIHETKRAMPILQAFNRLSSPNAFYIFAGKLDPAIETEFNQYIKTNHLEDRVKVTGYVNIDVFIDYIDLADICINLRYPYNGETSGSLMRILAKGKCVAVNAIGAFNEIPDNCCYKIPNTSALTHLEEVQHIYTMMQQFTSDNATAIETGLNARQYAEDYLDINIIAKEYYSFITEDILCSLNEKDLHNIFYCEMKPNKYSDDEVKLLSKTLAYTIKEDLRSSFIPDRHRQEIMLHKKITEQSHPLKSANC